MGAIWVILIVLFVGGCVALVYPTVARAFSGTRPLDGPFADAIGLFDVGSFEAAADAARELLERPGTLDGDQLTRLGAVLLQVEDLGGAITALTRALEHPHATKDDNEPWVLTARFLLAHAAEAAGRFEVAREHGKWVLENPVSSWELKVDAMLLLAEYERQAGEARLARYLLDSADRALDEHAASPAPAADAISNDVFTALRAAVSVGDANAKRAWVKRCRGRLAHDEGDLWNASALLNDARADIGARRQRLVTLDYADVLIDMFELDDARRIADEADQRVGDDRVSTAGFRDLVVARLILAAGDVERAATHLDRAEQALRSSWRAMLVARVHWERARVEVARDQPAVAVHLLNQAETEYRMLGVTRELKLIEAERRVLRDR